MLLTLPGLCSPQLYPRQSWSAAPGARARSGGFVRQSVWNFPILHGRLPVVAERIPEARVITAPHARQPWPAPLNARGGSDGRVRESVWSFPYRYERVPVVAKRMLETRGSDPCSGGGEATQEARQSRRHDCKDTTETRATPATSTTPPANRCVLEHLFSPGVHSTGGWHLPSPLVQSNGSPDDTACHVITLSAGRLLVMGDAWLSRGLVTPLVVMTQC